MSTGNGGNEGMLNFGRFVHDEKTARDRKQREALDRSRQRDQAACAWVAKRMPEAVDGSGPNPLVVAAALGVSMARGFEAVTPDAVRARLRAQRPWEYELLYANTDKETP